jgi:hypothetical protein
VGRLQSDPLVTHTEQPGQRLFTGLGVECRLQRFETFTPNTEPAKGSHDALGRGLVTKHQRNGGLTVQVVLDPSEGVFVAP